MKLRLALAIISAALFISSPFVIAQVDTVIGQFTSSGEESFVGGISGDGRYVVFESRGNHASINPRNEDGNYEIFLFDYAQRRIFQITNTKSVKIDPNVLPISSNIRVEITNRRPTISNDGRWIAFSSNATSSTPGTPDSTNPGSFDGNSLNTQAPPVCTLPSPTPTPTPTATPTPSPTPTPTSSPTPAPTPFNNPLDCDGNLEMWMYEVPVAPPADLTTGEEVALVDLGAGVFLNVTNTPPSRLPQRSTTISGAFVADDNHDATIDDDGSVIAFVSTRDLVAGGNPFPDQDNDEIFTFVRGGGGSPKLEAKNSFVGGSPCSPITGGSVCQVTQTPRGPIFDPIYNKNPTISGDGLRVVFASTGENPVIGMTGGNNPSTSRNEEIVAADLGLDGAPTGVARQITVTTSTNPGDPVNILEVGRRMSRDGRYIAFDSYADLANEHSGTNQTSFTTYLYDYNSSTFRRIGARSNADAEALGGDVSRYPGFTDYDMNGSPATLVLETRMNITSAGVIPTNENDGLNPVDGRPAQIYSFDLTTAPANPVFTRLTKFPLPTAFLASTQPIPSNSSRRISFNLALTEVGTGNRDLRSEAYYLYEPIKLTETPASFNLATGASRMPVSPTAVPSPSPTPTPTATPTPTPTPTPSPSPTPTGSPTPTPSPTPQTPSAVLGVSPGMLAILNYASGTNQPLIARTAEGSFERRFPLPIELSGVTMTINGAACGLKSVSRHQIEFVVPPGLLSGLDGTTYPLVVNNNGTVFRGDVTIVPARPDIFTTSLVAGPGGRALVKNVTNRVHTTEPFTATTIVIRGGRRTESVLRVYLTGVEGVVSDDVLVRIGSTLIFGTRITTRAVPVEPGVYYIDFTLPPMVSGAGDVPVIVEINAAGRIFRSRLDDTAPRIFIL